MRADSQHVAPERLQRLRIVDRARAGEFHQPLHAAPQLRIGKGAVAPTADRPLRRDRAAGIGSGDGLLAAGALIRTAVSISAAASPSCCWMNSDSARTRVPRETRVRNWSATRASARRPDVKATTPSERRKPAKTAGRRRRRDSPDRGIALFKLPEGIGTFVDARRVAAIRDEYKCFPSSSPRFQIFQSVD